jgi:Beta-lactamase class A
MFKDEIQALIERQPTKDISYKIEFDNQIYVHREHAVYPSASTIKVPIALINLQQHFHNYEDISLTVGKKVGGCGVLHTLESVKRLTLWDTIVLAIIISDNTASNMLIDNIGIDRINEGFTALGLHDTTLARNYYDTTGINEGKRNATSAADMFTSMST